MFFLLPYGNDRRTRRFPAVTYALIAANVGMYLWMLPFDRQTILNDLGLTPLNPSISDVISSMFVHADLLHLAWNMLFLWLFGPNVEDALGRLEYTIFYFGSGFAASLLHVVVVHFLMPAASDVPMVGASGAIAGILGIFAIRFYKTNIKVWYLVFCLIVRAGTFIVPAWIGLSVWFIQQLVGAVFGFLEPESGGVAYWSHIGGILFGTVLAAVLRMGLEGTKEYLMTDARTSLEQGTTWDAAENLRNLLKHDPDNAEAHAELARTYHCQQNHAKAVAHYRKSIELHLRRGERDLAIERYDEARQRYPDVRLDLRTENQLARLLIDAGYAPAAVYLLEKIIASYPGTPEAEISLVRAGDLYLNVLSDRRAAVRCYERFLEEYPHSEYRPMVEKALYRAKAES